MGYTQCHGKQYVMGYILWNVKQDEFGARVNGYRQDNVDTNRTLSTTPSWSPSKEKLEYRIQYIQEPT